MNNLKQMLTVCGMCFLGVMVAQAGVTADGAKVEKVSGGYRFTEGPAVDKDGNVFFTDIPNNKVHKYDVKKNKVEEVRGDSQRANGLMFSKDGKLYACVGGGRVLGIFTGADYKGLKVLASSYNGKKLNSPNDLVLDDAGGVYFTDPRYGSRDSMEMQIEGVYYYAKDGKLTRVIDDLKKPNGLILSLDKKTLYVADNGAKTIVAYTVSGPGKLTNKRLFANMDLSAGGGGDGMTLDAKGNVYCAGQGHIWVWDKNGKVVEKIKIPEGPSNCTFGGPNRDVLYITARTSFYKIKMKVKGVK